MLPVTTVEVADARTTATVSGHSTTVDVDRHETTVCDTSTGERMADYVIKKGDRGVSLNATLRKAGVVMDLTGATVTFCLRTKDNKTLKISNASVTVLSAAAGTVQYDWAAIDVDTPGLYHAEFKVTLTGKITTFPNAFHLTVEILPDLD